MQRLFNEKTTFYQAKFIRVLLCPNNPLNFRYRTCMANSAENKSFCEVPKYVINTRPHCPKLMKFTCYTHAQSWNTESCIATIAIQLPKVDYNIVVTA